MCVNGEETRLNRKPLILTRPGRVSPFKVELRFRLRLMRHYELQESERHGSKKAVAGALAIRESIVQRPVDVVVSIIRRRALRAVRTEIISSGRPLARA